MPFTLSHAVLAPILARASKQTLPLAALAIGCMLPDLYRLFVTDAGRIAHSWSGQIYPNLFIGLGFCALWYLIYRPMLYRLFNLIDPIQIYNLFSAFKFIVCMLIALLVGNATHILWDGLTHVDFRTLILHDFLSQPVHWFGSGYPLHFILQITSSVAALPLLGYWIMRYIQRYHVSDLHSFTLRAIIAAIFALATLLAAYWSYDYLTQFPLQALQQHRYYFIGRAFNEFSQIFLLLSTFALTILSIWQQLFRDKYQL